MKTKTSRVLSVYHLFLNCEEVSFQEFTLSFLFYDFWEERGVVIALAGPGRTHYHR